MGWKWRCGAEENKKEAEKRGDVESRQEGGKKEGMYQQDM